MDLLKSFFILQSLILLGNSTFSQIRHNEFSAELLRFESIDKSLAPLKNFGIGGRLSYSYIQENGDSRSSYLINGMYSNVKSDIETTRKSQVGHLRFTYSYERKVSTHFLFGLNAQAIYKDSFYKNIDQSHIYWSNFIGLGLSGSYELDINTSNQMKINLLLPMLGIASRNKDRRLYKVDDPSFGNIIKINHSGYRFASAESYINPVLELSFNHNLSNRTTLVFFVRTEYTSVENRSTVPYSELQNGFGFRLKSIKVTR